MSARPAEKETHGSVALSWWARLQGNGSFKGDAGSRTALARADTLLALMTQPAAAELFSKLPAEYRPRFEQVALTAGVLAQVRENAVSRSLGRHLGALRPGSDSRVMNPHRFARLLKIAEPELLLGEWRRTVHLLGRTMPIIDLAETLLDWNDRRKQRLVYQFWGFSEPSSLPSS
ncbi:type I-E CRISPR-associated protein Cse2/CasB [Sabulicella rubraurantiaca]|uniref:type I-E CRISPR-associated protein Cse2/CasB n=1 Tax=Sabulicella rubraurantiaca TaxID=2811429 RepID=UPI001A978EAF|nr:type I-E CRISPR-associated protein Cse2/CasB [Sabulicella rubraurantiaca]